MHSIREILSEIIGTFFLVFCGTGAIIIHEQTGGTPSHAGIAATFGGIVMIMIYTLGKISGAHMNPAVSIAFVVNGVMTIGKCFRFIIAQAAGAFLASFILKILFPESENLGSTIPAGSDMQSFVLEFILVFLLMLVILKVADGSKESGIIAAVAIGSTVFIGAMFAGPICGASMNPIRSLAPAMVSGNLEHIWIYLTAPVGGALTAVLANYLLNEKTK